MNTGNNTAGKTAPERYVSEKAFEELPDAFQKLAELLGEDQFELVAVNEKGSQDIYVRNGEIRLVYLMNDAVESFLVFGNARMTGVYKPDYEGEILADLSRQGREYILVVHQDDSVVTLFFETLTLEKHLYDYSQIGHFWVEGYEYLRQLEYRLAILRDKYDYIGGDSCNALEEKLSALVEFPPLNYCCYPAVPEKYIVPREEPWIPSERAVSVMKEIAREAGDRTFVSATTSTPTITLFTTFMLSPLFLQLSIPDCDNSLGMCRNFRIMRDHQYRNSLIIQFLKKFHNLCAGFGIQRTGWFIREKKLRIIYNCSCNGNSLHLSTG